RIGIAAAGGTIAAENFDVELRQPAMHARFTVDGVDLGEVTRVLGIQGLDGTGVLDGTVPLSVAGEEVAITDAQLSARGPGVLRYRPDNLPPQIAQAGAEVDLVLRALADFHYDSLGLTFGKAVGGEGFVRLAMAGANPAVMDSQPFNFNIRIESNFARLADLVLLGLRSAQDLLGRAAGSVRP
ncbi:MAG: YdbH domain-containing protein, partial [Zavarzinia sp.]|nr:YdbH domain-containing protein [Zavarzinia sp.]